MGADARGSFVFFLRWQSCHHRRRVADRRGGWKRNPEQTFERPRGNRKESQLNLTPSLRSSTERSTESYRLAGERAIKSEPWDWEWGPFIATRFRNEEAA